MKQDFLQGSRTLGKLGENFPAWRFDRVISQSEKQNWVIERCKNFIPGLVSINNPKSGDMYRLVVRVNFEGKNHDLNFQELSDGQKVLMALYYILANTPDRSTLILDEPENFLAPGELQPWLNAMHDAWEERDIQFIVISHNPITLNWFHNEAFIFEAGGEPPRVTFHRNGGDKEGLTLFNKLCEMEWAANEAGF
jgi:predicted ATPase